MVSTESQSGDVPDPGGDQSLRPLRFEIDGEDRLLAIIGHEDFSGDRVERHPVEEDLEGIGLGCFVPSEGLRFQFDQIVGDAQQEVLSLDRFATRMFVRLQAHTVRACAGVAVVRCQQTEMGAEVAQAWVIALRLERGVVDVDVWKKKSNN